MPDATATVSDRDLSDLYAFRAIGASPAEVTKKITELERDNQKQRLEIDGYKEKVKAVPAEGAVVLTGDDAKAHEAFKALALKPEEVAKVVKERDELAGKVATRERQDAFGKVAKLGDYSEDAIATMLDMESLKGASWEFKPVKVKDKAGKEVDSEEAYVTLPGEGQKPQKFSEYAAAAPQLKGLKPAEANGDSGARIVPEQRGSTGDRGTVTGGVDDLLAANQKAATAPNPFSPAKVA